MSLFINVAIHFFSYLSGNMKHLFRLFNLSFFFRSAFRPDLNLYTRLYTISLCKNTTVSSQYFPNFLLGATYTVQPIVFLEYFGEKYIAEFLGSVMLFYGVAAFIGAPTAGSSVQFCSFHPFFVRLFNFSFLPFPCFAPCLVFFRSFFHSVFCLFLSLFFRSISLRSFFRSFLFRSFVSASFCPFCQYFVCMLG